LWHNDRIDNMPEPMPGCLDKFVAEKAKDRMGNIASCDLLLWMRTVIEASWSLASSLSWI
jgi:hypothetical protein